MSRRKNALLQEKLRRRKVRYPRLIGKSKPALESLDNSCCPMRMDHAKELPPITLSNTTISYLVALIPLLVSMTTRHEVPSYEDESDKPAWWPDDVQWKNPKVYMQDTEKKGDGLKVLRKLVHSCYSYHGVEDLLCRLDESAMSENESEHQEMMEIIQLSSEDTEETPESSAESEGPVFVCCFCLEQFNSHDEVNSHQNQCQNRKKPLPVQAVNVSQNSRSQPESPLSTEVEPFLDATEPPCKDEALETNDNLRSVSSVLSPPALSPSVISSEDRFEHDCSSQGSSPCSPKPSSPRPPPKKPQASTFTFVPTLKTRSQKKLDQIIEKHNLKQLMIKECKEMKEVPATGAWWVRKKRRKRATSPSEHPGSYLSQDPYMSNLGLVKTTDLKVRESEIPKKEQEVDLDCEIVSVEGPLSAVPSTCVGKTSAVSPRSTRSLISQLSRGCEVNSCRRISFCFVEDEWADKEALEEGRDPLQVSLLSLAVSSPLGQRVKKYMKGEGHMNIIKDVESYCRTEEDDDSYSKLRMRGTDFRVTFRKKRRASNFVHKYKFNRTDRLEFKRYLRTGLSLKSHYLMQCLPQCRVVLTKMTDAEIKSFTEERRITFAQEIVYDDDICITQIEIPESKVIQGLAQEKKSLHRPMSNKSHPHNHRHRPGPSSHCNRNGLGTSGINRPSFSSHLTSSPPHVPNIFRNRTSHAPSPPRPGPKSYTQSHRPFIGPKFAVARVNKNFNGQEASKYVYTPLHEANALSNQLGRTDRKPAHLSQHKPLPPSAYSSDLSLSYRGFNNHNSNGNRRKQLMTDVRRDDFDAASSHSSDKSRAFIPLGANKRNPFSRVSTLSRYPPDSKPRPSLESHKSATPPPRKLSNFDYFSIRDGEIRAGQSPHGRIISNHQNVKSLPTSRHHHHNLLSHQAKQGQHMSGNSSNHNSRPSSSSSSSQPPQIANHSNHHHKPQATSSLGNPGSVIHYIPSQHNHSAPCGNRKPMVNSKPSNHQNFHQSKGPSTVRGGNPKGPTFMEHLRSTVVAPNLAQVQTHSHTSQKKVEDDEDVMEVICIDDD